MNEKRDLPNGILIILFPWTSCLNSCLSLPLKKKKKKAELMHAFILTLRYGILISAWTRLECCLFLCAHACVSVRARVCDFKADIHAVALTADIWFESWSFSFLLLNDITCQQGLFVFNVILKKPNFGEFLGLPKGIKFHSWNKGHLFFYLLWKYKHVGLFCEHSESFPESW